MANLRTIRILLIFVMLFLLPCLCICSPAQVIPFAPGFPTDVKQCQSFGVEVDAYTAEYSQQHEKCLADHKADHTTETDPLTCTRSECQYLHDMLHGNSVLSAKSLSAEVSSCYAKVREYQAQEAQKAKEEEERRARDKREEAEGQARDKKDEAERAASRQRDKDEREARDAKRAADKSERDQVEEQREAAERQAESDRNQLTAQATARATPQATQRNSSPNQKLNSSASLVDPFPNAKSAPQRTEVGANESLVDPFGSKETLVDPFSNSDRTHSEVTWDDAKGLSQGLIDKAAENLEHILTNAKSSMSPEQFARLEHTVGDARSSLGGLSHVITAITFQKDLETIAANPHDPNSYRDIISDFASYGTSYVLKRLSPDLLSKLWEGPPGWTLAITFHSSSTQTANQDFDPMTALNNPGQYNFQQREAALQSLYQSAQKHPEIWNQKRYEWLYGVSERLYNSPDNPNFHLTPP